MPLSFHGGTGKEVDHYVAIGSFKRRETLGKMNVFDVEGG
jgi:hypothetical protein